MKNNLGLILIFITLFSTPLFAENNLPSCPQETSLTATGKLTEATVTTYMTKINPQLPPALIHHIYTLYKSEAKTEGINKDIALAQMMLETNFLRYTGDVQANQFNFAGIGAVGGGAKGAIFPNMQMGIRAQIQHLQAYATTDCLIHPQIDPRYHYVKRGSAKTLSDLTGRWATDPQYAKSIFRILTEMYTLQFSSP